MAYSTILLEGQIDASGNLTAITTAPVQGLMLDVRVNVLQSNKSSTSSNTVTVTLKEQLMGSFNSTLFTKASITGISNRFAPQVEIVTSTGTSTALYRPYSLSGHVQLTCASGTQNDWVIVTITVAS